MKRGEIWTLAANAPYANKPRLAVIIQSDNFDSTESVTVCGFTRIAPQALYLRISVTPNPQNNLAELSFIMVDKTTTVPRSRLGKRIGMLNSQELVLLDRALLVFLGLA
ncbi:MAG TPA: type II toxin-antitoxin system PemK/MazF family toxin [Rhizomicrobium sp.]